MTRLFVTTTMSALALVVILATRSSAQGMAQSGPGPMRQQVQSGSAVSGRVPDANTAVNKRVRDWFAKYDEIRHRAQMVPAEKRNAHKLVTVAVTGDTNDKIAARNLLTRMVSRYERATEQLKALPQIPQTVELQLNYLRYFETGKGIFKRYLNELSTSGKPQVLDLSTSRRKLAGMNVDNKLLDRNLRKKYKIAPYKWD